MKQKGQLIGCVANAHNDLRGRPAYATKDGGYIEEDPTCKAERISEELKRVHAKLVQIQKAVVKNDMRRILRILGSNMSFGFDPDA